MAAHVVLVEGGEEAVAVPDPVHDDRVHEAGDAEGVDQVRLARVARGGRGLVSATEAGHEQRRCAVCGVRGD